MLQECLKVCFLHKDTKNVAMTGYPWPVFCDYSSISSLSFSYFDHEWHELHDFRPMNATKSDAIRATHAIRG